MNHEDKDHVIKDLISTLRNGRTWEEQSQATDALIAFGGLAVKPLMLKIRQNFFDTFTLPNAVKALGDIGNTQSVDLLIELLDSGNVHVAQAAAKGLGNIGDARAIPALIHSFSHDWDDEETITMWQEASGALAAMGDIAYPPLISALQDSNSDVRSGVIVAFGKLKNAYAIIPLIQMLQDNDSQVKADAADALAELGAHDAIESLVSLLKDEHWYVRSRVLYALGELGTASIFGTLIECLHDPAPQVRSATVVALGKIRGEQQMEILLSLLKNQHIEVRDAAILALAQTANEQALPDLQWIQQNDVGYWGANRLSDHAAYAIKCIQARSQRGQ